MKPITTPGGYVITKPLDIIIITCNRLQITKVTIDDLHERIKVPFRLIAVDDMSIDGTAEYLQEQKNLGRVDVYKQLDNSNICQAYNKGFEFVESDYFFTMQDDITVPDLDPCVTLQLIDLMEKYPGHAGIGCRIQRIPNMRWLDGDLTPARKALSAYFRIQHKDTFKGLELPFGNRNWDDLHFVSFFRDRMGMKCSWANNLWADHSRGYCLDRGYVTKPRKWGTGIHTRKRQAHVEKPYPAIDTKKNIPLHIINADNIVQKEFNQDQDFFGFIMRTRKDYKDERILRAEMNPNRDVYRIPKNPKLVIDVGAHIGGTAMICAKRGAKVFAFEPELSNFNLLKYNVKRNKLSDKIFCFNYGLGVPGRYKLNISDLNSGGMSVRRVRTKTIKKQQIIFLKSLKDIFKEMEIKHCDFLKADCEGGEEDILSEIDDEMASKINQISVELHRKILIDKFVKFLSRWYVPERITKYEWVFRRKG